VSGQVESAPVIGKAVTSAVSDASIRWSLGHLSDLTLQAGHENRKVLASWGEALHPN